MGPLRIHIIAFDIPYPADYGGVIDIYYRIRALHELGIKIILHCFQYSKPIAPALLEWCTAVHYYPRPVYRDLLSMRLPYIVASRQDPNLIRHLMMDDAPILFEGLHTTALLSHPDLINRMKIVRMHNVEHEYYHQLGVQESNPLRRAFFHVEAARLKKYESILSHAQGIAAISQKDEVAFRKKYRNSVFLMPAFHGYDVVKSLTGLGEFALFHGNLAISENHRAALFLIKEVFSKLNYPLIIAGKNPKAGLYKAAAGHSNISINANPDSPELEKLIQHAQVMVLPTFQDTGLKLKLMNSLFLGRHIITNAQMVSGTGLEDLVEIAKDAESFHALIQKFTQQPFTDGDIHRRTEILIPAFNPMHHARLLVERLSSM